MSTTLLPPGPRTRIPGRALFGMQRDRLGFVQRLARDYGDIAHVKIGPQHIYLLSRPEDIRDVLVTNHRNFRKARGLERAKLLLGNGLLTSEGDFHLRQRRLAQPAFHRQRIAQYANAMVACALRARDRWHDGEERDIARDMTALTLAIVGRTLFDTDVEAEAPEIGDALTTSLELFRIALLPFSELIDTLPLPSVRRFRQARARLDATIYRIIRERRANSEDRGDLLSMLLLAHDTEGDGAGMTDEQLRDEAMTIFLAGHETTANALTWSWYLLSLHPDVERAMHAEVDAVLEDRPATMDDVARLPYTRMVLAESMRLYPPAWIIGRKSIDDYEVSGYRIPAGSVLLMSQYVVHHDARHYPDPERFAPERWTPEAQAARAKFSYFPFGGGPRQCIGEHFAWTEGILLLATIAQRWRLRHVAGHRVALQPLITLRPRYGMRMTIHRR
ncbi:MAG TPA: cytochrome P450 [Gemmatimonadaceae bacterium]|nr:cytochrome P450 [Gemmatimonadaceae bacterium]